MKKVCNIIFICIISLSLILSSLTYIITSPTLNETNYIEIYDKDDNLIYTELYQVKSEYIYLNQLNSYTYQSFIAIEDKNFFKHKGFDLGRNIQAFFTNLFSFKIRQGASTITQQYARNTLLNNKRTFSRKIKEAFYTIQIERKYSKTKILEGYLNSLYFGHGLTGIESASNYYFNKSSYNLTIAESAMLAGICNAPSYYSPKINETKAKQRQELVLYNMLIQNYISQNEYQQALKEELNYSFKKENSSNFNYYKDAIVTQLTDLDIYNKKNLLKGLKIYTNIDYSLYEEIDNIIKKYKTKNDDTQISIIIMEPFTNKILYMTGGYDYSESSYNRALYSSRQIGSTIKPLIYYLALANGFSPNTLLTSEETTFNIENIGEYSPKNPNNSYANDKIDMIQAIAVSDNIYALKTLLLLGSNNLVKLLNLFGIENTPSLPSIALGTITTSLIKLTSIYNTFASLGEYYEPSFIRKVEDSYGNHLFTQKNIHYTLLDDTNALILNQMLTSTFDSSLSTYLSATMSNYKPYNIYSAKSGTTKNDSYVMSFNPNYTIGIWVGSDTNNNFSSYSLPKVIYKEITNILGNKKEISWYNTNYQTTAKRYNPNTHSFDNTGNIYYFKSI